MSDQRRFSLAAAAVAVVLLAFLAWLTSGAGSPLAREVVSDLLFLSASLAAAVTCSRAAQREHGRSRLPWSLLSGTGWAWVAGNTLWFYNRVIVGDASFPNTQDVFLLLALVSAAAALIAFLSGSVARLRPLRLLLEALIIASSLLFLSWDWLLGDLYRTAGLPAVARTVLLAYPAGDVVLASLALFLFVRAPRAARLQIGLVAGGFLAYALADSFFAYLGLTDRFQMGTLADLGWVGGYLLIALAPLAPGSSWASARGHGDERTVLRELLLYVPTLLAFVQAVAFDLRQDPFLLVLGLTLLLLHTARHGLAVVENLSLTRELQHTVALRTSELRSILDGAAEGIYGLDLEGRVTFVNAAGAGLTGHEVAELLGRHRHETVHHARSDGSPYPREDCPVTSCLGDGVATRGVDEVYWRKDGTSFPVEYTATPLRQGDRMTGAVVTFRDITERRAAERAKDEFTSVVSHELRTPLTSIRGSLGLLAGGVLGPLPEKGQRMLDIAVSNTDRLIRLINDILDIERLESGKISLERQPCDAGQLLSSAAEVMQAMAGEAGVRLVVHPTTAQAWADPDRMLQTLTNLLSNAVKFSPPGGTVWLAAAPQGGQVLFTVTDEGRGIPPDKLEAVFARFQQVDASDSRDKGGTGLGLAICRSIVTQHGGRIWVESTAGVGSTFSFTVPALPGREVAVPRTERALPSVLVCDDDPAILEVVEALLRRHGYHVLTVDSGERALVTAAAEQPDVILLDLLLPGMSGWETAAALNRRPETRTIPLVILSVLSIDETEEPEAEVADWVGKPLDEGRLITALDRALHGAKARRVLVVEDDPDLGRVITAMFERRGMETVHARTGREAIRLSQRLVPDLLVLDVGLPDQDGFAVVEWLREHERLHEVPLLVYTARELDDADRRRLQLGQTAFLTKGRISPEDFDRQVTLLLDRITAPGQRVPG